MSEVRVNFDGDAQKLVAEMRRVQQEIRREDAARRKSDQQQRQHSRREQQRLRDRINGGKRAKQITEQLGSTARKALADSVTPQERYNRALYEQERALRAGAISLDQYKRAKFALLRTLRDARREQSGENEELREAARLVKNAQTATDRYQSKVRALQTAQRRGKITKDQ